MDSLKSLGGKKKKPAARKSPAKKKGAATSKLNVLIEDSPEESKKSPVATPKKVSQADTSDLEIPKENIEELEIPKPAAPTMAPKNSAKKAVTQSSPARQKNQPKEIFENEAEERRHFVENLRAETQAFLKQLTQERLQRQQEYQAKKK